MRADIGDVITGIGDMISLIYHSISNFFTGIVYSFTIVNNFISSLPIVFSYGIRLSVSIMVTLLVVNTLKGMIA